MGNGSYVSKDTKDRIELIILTFIPYLSSLLRPAHLSQRRKSVFFPLQFLACFLVMFDSLMDTQRSKQLAGIAALVLNARGSEVRGKHMRSRLVSTARPVLDLMDRSLIHSMYPSYRYFCDVHVE